MHKLWKPRALILLKWNLTLLSFIVNIRYACLSTCCTYLTWVLGLLNREATFGAREQLLGQKLHFPKDHISANLKKSNWRFSNYFFTYTKSILDFYCGHFPRRIHFNHEKQSLFECEVHFKKHEMQSWLTLNGKKACFK